MFIVIQSVITAGRVLEPYKHIKQTKSTSSVMIYCVIIRRAIVTNKKHTSYYIIISNNGYSTQSYPRFRVLCKRIYT